MKYSLRLCAWQEAEPQLRAVREAVFMREQAVPAELEWDGLDESAQHVLAISDAGEAIACGRILSNAHIGRIAVLKSWRRKQVGSAVLEKLLAYARENNYPQVDLDAQVQALPFYQRFGFVAEGEVFMDANIPHRKLRLKLDR